MNGPPPPGGMALYCPCGSNWLSLQRIIGPRLTTGLASRIAAAAGFGRVPCLRCGGTIAAVPASAEGARR